MAAVILYVPLNCNKTLKMKKKKTMSTQFYTFEYVTLWNQNIDERYFDGSFSNISDQSFIDALQDIII